MRVTEVDWYDYPQYYDMLFQEDTLREADFLEGAFKKYCPFPVREVLEPGCGSGRLVVELAKRGYQMTAFDLNDASLSFLKKRLDRCRRSAQLQNQDMSDFELSRPVDAAYCLVNTFRHLLDERSAASHLRSVAKALRPGGVYVLGLHLFPPDAIDECTERWTATRGKTRVTGTLRVLETDHRRRLEKIRVTVRVHRPPAADLRMRSEFSLRRYSATQLKRLLALVPEFALRDVFDFWYELDSPLKLNNDLADTVLILQRND